MARSCLERRRAMLGAAAAAGLLVAFPLPAARTRMTALYADAGLARYGFPAGHPLGVDRQGAFLKEAAAQGLLERAARPASREASREEIERFHTPAYVDRVRDAERSALEFLDNGDTPVFPGVYEAGSIVVGAALDGLQRVMDGEFERTLQPVGGLHHAGRGHAAGFCVFNDLGVVIETLRTRYGIRRIAYIDIDVHHGDGIFYAYESDPDLVFADIHEDGRFLYPGTGRAEETGLGPAAGTKLNIPLKPGSGDAEFAQAWRKVEAHLDRFAPQFIVFQCGADGLEGDPLAHLKYTPATHALAAKSLRALAKRHAKGRLMAFGGGGYGRDNLARAWSAVLRELI